MGEILLKLRMCAFLSSFLEVSKTSVPLRGHLFEYSVLVPLLASITPCATILLL